jgi:hypothetical protein
MADDSDLDDPARAFDQLRREVSLCVRAIQGFTAERQNTPDYSQTLRSIDARLQEAADSIARMAQAPAIQLTPTDIGRELEHAAAAAREGDRRLLEAAQRGNADNAHQLRLAIQQVRTAEAQWRRVLWGAAGGFVLGVLAMLLAWWTFR